MTVELIGAGFGRTGTSSIRMALERIGAGPCHHMSEVFANPGQIATWHTAARGEAVDWPAFLSGYRSLIDWPSSYFWRDLMRAFPEAKVLLTVRDPEAWWESFSQTILTMLDVASFPDPALAGWPAMVDAIVTQGTFGGRPGDRDHVIAVFERHIAEVKAEVPADRLLVYEARQGWQPLCDFMGVPVPDEAFPRVNDTAEFKARAQQRAGGAD